MEGQKWQGESDYEFFMNPSNALIMKESFKIAIFVCFDSPNRMANLMLPKTHEHWLKQVEKNVAYFS